MPENEKPPAMRVDIYYAVSDAISKVSNDSSEIAVEHEEHICYYNVY